MKKIVFFSSLFYLQLIVSQLSAQGWQWATGSRCVNSCYIEASQIAVDKSGYVYELGFLDHYGSSTDSLKATFGPYSVIDSTNGGFQYDLVSTDSNGNYRWVLAVQDGGPQFYNLVTDSFGNIYIIGEALGHFNFGSWYYSGAFFMAKVNSSGTVLWIRDCAWGASTIAIDGHGNLYLGGFFTGPTLTIGSTTLTNANPSTDDIFLAKYDSSGAPIWASSFGGPGDEQINSIAVTPDSQTYLVGIYLSTSMIIAHDTITGTGAPTQFIVKYSATGNPVWGKRISADTSSATFCVTADQAGDAYVTGWFYHGNFTFGTDTLPLGWSGESMFLVKYDSSGSPLWGRGADFAQVGYSVGTDQCNVWVCGTGTTHTGADSLFLAEFTKDGVLEDSVMVNSGGDDNSAMALDGSGNIYIGGDYLNDTTFVAGPYSLHVDDSALETMFVLKYKYILKPCPFDSAALQVAPAARNTAISLYPNPAGQEVFVWDGFYNTGSKVEILDITGRVMRQYPLTGTTTSIPLTGITPGMYECRIYNSGQRTETLKLVVMQ